MELFVTTATRTSNSTDVHSSIRGRNGISLFVMFRPNVGPNEWILGILLRRGNDLIMKMTTHLRLVSG
jgi:hypothetical protein